MDYEAAVMEFFMTNLQYVRISSVSYRRDLELP